MTSPLVSVIMSTKDTDEKMLRTAIISIINQTYHNFEFIIICDGGKNDLRIVKSFKDTRIKVITHQNSIGLTKSLNEGLAIANGQFIARMDADDFSLQHRLDAQINYMTKHPEIDICATLTKNFGDNHSITIPQSFQPTGVKASLFLNNIIVHPTVMIRKSFLDKHALIYNPSFRCGQDYELWSRCSKIGNISIIPQICLLYRIHSQQITASRRDEQNDSRLRIYRKNLMELGIINTSKDAQLLLNLYTTSNPILIADYLDVTQRIAVANQKSKIYNPKKLQKTLYLRLLSCELKRNHRVIPLSIIFKNHLIGEYFKKITLSSYYHIIFFIFYHPLRIQKILTKESYV